MSGRSRRPAQRTSRGPIRGAGQDDSAMPDVYKDMLSEAASSEPSRFKDDGRTIKRRKIGPVRGVAGGKEGAEGSQDVPERSAEPIPAPDDGFEDLFEERPAPQVAYSDFEDSEESDVDWEEVDLVNEDRENILGSEDEDQEEGDGGDLDLVLLSPKGKGKRTNLPKRRPITAVERKLRLEVHKMHLLCLLYHVFLRNSWCSDPEIQAVLKPLLAGRTLSFLNPDPEKTQFQRTTLFTAGLTEVSSLWASKFKITARGTKKAVWTDDEEKLKNYRLPEDVDLPMEKSDFRDHARKLEGSRDVGAQLFCALLRSVGVTSRLVCSLQPLPFNFVTATKGSTPQKSQPKTIYPADDRENTSDDAGSVDVQNMNASAGSGSVQGVLPQTPRGARRLWQPDFRSGSRSLGKPPPKVPRARRIRESTYPVYWVEAFNVAHQKWIPVDPLTTHSVGKPSKFEPPASEAESSMSYVVAFEEGDARDVTKRYAKAINAKTRKARVEVTKGGDRWWKKTMGFFEREFDLVCLPLFLKVTSCDGNLIRVYFDDLGFQQDRDQVETAEFAAREAQEEMPRNVQDFKGHPYYALERHLRRNEVVHPKREIGKLTAGPASKAKGLEPIYRRSDVHVVKSADAWYRAGREIKPGEQPLKHIQPKRGQVRFLDDDEQDDPGEGSGAGLYAAFQTVVYEPPPVVNGRVPKNSYGNIDIYAPSMVPKGGVHLPHLDAACAARLLCIDYAEAVTGFEFKGRRGTAITRGIVAAAEYREALEAVIQGLADVRDEEEVAKRGMRALAFWKRFLIALRIKERIAGYEILGEVGDGGKEEEAVVDEGDEGSESRGGFFPERGVERVAEPTVGNALGLKKRRGSSRDGPLYAGETGTGFLHPWNTDSAAATYSGDFVPNEPPTPTNEAGWHEGGGGGGFIPEDEEAYANTRGGGFVLDGDDGGGGFIPDGADATTAAEGRGYLPGNSGDAGAAEGGGFLPGDDAALVDAHEQVQDPPPAAGISSHRSRDGGLWANPQIAALLSPPPPQPLPLTTPHPQATIPPPTRHHDSDDDNGSGDDGFDRGSLLSHDPEDDDAEPDWLVSD